MLMPGRNYFAANTDYRYGFNGKENDNDIETGMQDYGMRIYDGRLGRFLSTDPLTPKYPELTPYQFASNRPVDGTDVDGTEYNSASTYVYKVLPILKPNSAPFILKEQPTLSEDRFPNGTPQSRELKASYLRNQAYNKATMDPLAASMIYPVANAVGQFTEGTIDHAYKSFKGYSQGNFWEGTKNAGLFILDVAPFIPVKGASTIAEIFSTSIKTRGAAEEFALASDAYKGQGFSNMNDIIKNNPDFDLYSFQTSTIVDVTTTTSESMNFTGLTKKLDNLSQSSKPFTNRVLQVYVPEGRYTTKQLESLETRLEGFIKDYQLRSTFRITEISSSSTTYPMINVAGGSSASQNQNK